MGSDAFSKNYMVKSSLKVSNIMQSIENFESYRNHCLHLIQVFVFIEKNQWQRGVYNFGIACIYPYIYTLISAPIYLYPYCYILTTMSHFYTLIFYTHTPILLQLYDYRYLLTPMYIYPCSCGFLQNLQSAANKISFSNWNN
jgi:hypothetical protein